MGPKFGGEYVNTNLLSDGELADLISRSTALRNRDPVRSTLNDDEDDDDDDDDHDDSEDGGMDGFMDAFGDGISQDCRDALFQEHRPAGESWRANWESNKLILLGLLPGPKQRVKKVEGKNGRKKYIIVNGLPCMRFKNADLECNCFGSACAELDETDFDWLPEAPAHELSDNEPVSVILSTEPITNSHASASHLPTMPPFPSGSHPPSGYPAHGWHAPGTWAAEES